jgi:hypothetical protein
LARFKKHLLVALGFALAGAIGTAFGTGKAQAIVATLVEVVNPTTSPVPILSIDTARAPYQSTVTKAGTCSGSSCTFTFPNVASGHRFFGSHLSGSVAFNPHPSIIYIEIDVGGAFNSAFFLGESSAVLFSVFNDPVAFVLDSPTSLSVKVTLFGNSAAFAGNQIMTLYGEDADCTALACPAITQ